MNTENILVKRGTGISAFGTPLIVIAAAPSWQPYWNGEYHALLGGRHPALLNQYTSVKVGDVPKDLVTIDAEFMRVELDQQAMGRLSVHCFDLYEKAGREGFLNKLELTDGEPTDILRSWLRKEHHDHIMQMREQTKIEQLRTFQAGRFADHANNKADLTR